MSIANKSLQTLTRRPSVKSCFLLCQGQLILPPGFPSLEFFNRKQESEAGRGVGIEGLAMGWGRGHGLAADTTERPLAVWSGHTSSLSSQACTWHPTPARAAAWRPSTSTTHATVMPAAQSLETAARILRACVAMVSLPLPSA